MKDESKIWLDYAEENLKSAKVLLKSELLNPCLQNIQQTIEKALKSILIEKTTKLKKTHSINDLKNILQNNGISIQLSDDECDFLDSIYLPSKYPIGNVLPYFEPGHEICNQAIKIAERVLNLAQDILK